ncbi:MAG TPA: 2-succinyl-5-enolpyruvyl-6-hydroxy-3-cyclohexene-1-carboxylic-acid synthase [Cryomorphaceae bacterium]|nr:2-succinyl-5-enolpyruvyl-6-hydroxy-3-cyclohexene-1-carboxylic-acid synthase [Cryomorphaceae bacterium]
MADAFQTLAALVAQALRGLSPALTVFSPGSRNAPLVEACRQVVGKRTTALDERAAAHIALGAAVASGRPAVAICTSGTAGLNYAPAVAEAFYQRLPLLVITADRPPHLIDQGHGQSIRQKAMYEGHLRGQALLDPSAPLEEQWDLLTVALEGLVFGPVHVNVPLAEPLYGRPTLPEGLDLAPWTMPALEPLELMMPEWIKEAHRPLLILGQWNPAWGSPQRAVNQLKQKGWLVAAEHLSQLEAGSALHLEDAWEHAPAARVDVVVTLGGAWIAKQSKKKLAGTPHWHIGPVAPHPNMFGSLQEATAMGSAEALQALAAISPSYEVDWSRIWRQRIAYSAGAWSDLWVYEQIAAEIPSGSDVHWANSTAVRYGVHTWAHGGWKGNYRHFSNRGASGIDGCSSTAIGSALVAQKPTWLLTGELAFFYDANAWMTPVLPQGLKVVVFNNGGGNIFRWIEGPKESEWLDSHFTWSHGRTCEHLAAHAGLSYSRVASMEEWGDRWPAFLAQPGPALLEVCTDAALSENAWKARFQP